MTLDEDQSIQLYQQMLAIRLFEEQVSRDAGEGFIPGPIHLSIGQEAIAAGVMGNLTVEDFMFSSHRAHGHALAKGVPMNELMAEIWGKETGVCKGRGGSMHIAHRPSGFLGANGVIGGGGPLAAGVGMAIRYLKTTAVVAVFFGDGAIAQGQLHEGLTMASVFSLPTLFVCENNGYAETVSSKFHLSGGDAAQRLSGYGRFRVEQIDGMDVLAVYEMAKDLISWMRETGRPAALECLTSRFSGHFEGDDMTYRTPDELAPWLERDPIVQMERRLSERGVDSERLTSIRAALGANVDTARAFASTSPHPELPDLMQRRR